MPRQIRTLVVEGGYEFYAQALEKAFGKDGVFMVNVVDDIAVLAATLGSGDYRVCVLTNVGGGGADPFDNAEFCRVVANWVGAGGILFVNGEVGAAKALARVFGKKSWRMDGDYYRRTDHELNRKCGFVPATPALPPSYNVKACMLQGVAPDERVYGATSSSVTHSLVPMMAGESVNKDMCAVAATHYGQGAVVFFGDVNAEECTMDVVLAMAKHLVG